MVVEAGVQLLESGWYHIFDDRIAAKKLDLLSGTLTLIPCSGSGHWSCIEVDQHAGTITHYDSLSGMHCYGTLEGTVKCSYCVHVRDIFSNTSEQLAPNGWKFRTPHCPQQDNGVDCGIFMLSFLGRRARKLDLSQNLDPGQCRYNMA